MRPRTAPRAASTRLLDRIFARLFRLSAEKEYVLHVQWQDKGRSFNRPVSPVLVRSLMAVLAFLAIGIGLLAFEAGMWTLREFRYHLAASRHKIHLAELRDIRSELQRIESTVDGVHRQEQRMRALYGMNYMGAAPELFAVGGRSYGGTEDSLLPQGIQEHVFHTQLKERQLRGRIDNSLRNFNQIREFVEYRHNTWDHTPSVAPAPGRYSSRFGHRVHPVFGRYAAHKGVDIAGARLTPVRATADGIVRSSSRQGGYGNLVVLDHGNGFTTRYGHLHRILVDQGQLVKRFDVVGYMGSTGTATGVHVHYEVLRDGIAMNPERFILPTGVVVD